MHNEKRSAIQIDNAVFNSEIVDHKKNGKSVYACYSSKKYLDDLEKTFENKRVSKNETILLADPTYIHRGKHVPIDGEAQNARIENYLSHFLLSCRCDFTILLRALK